MPVDAPVSRNAGGHLWAVQTHSLHNTTPSVTIERTVQAVLHQEQQLQMFQPRPSFLSLLPVLMHLQPLHLSRLNYPHMRQGTRLLMPGLLPHLHPLRLAQLHITMMAQEGIGSHMKVELQISFLPRQRRVFVNAAVVIRSSRAIVTLVQELLVVM